MAHATIWAILEHAERRFGERLAVIEGERRASYGELARRVRARAREWRALGVRRGERVAILDWNTGTFLESYFAAAGLGAILNPLNHRLAAPELAQILADSGARLVVASRSFASLVENLRERAGTVERWLWSEDDLPASPGAFEPAAVVPGDVAHLYYTSGTTGRSKGVMLTHRNVCVHAEWAVRELALTGDDRWGHFAPMFHLADAWATFALTQVGGVHVMVPRFEADLAPDCIQRDGITLTNLIPTMLKRLVESPRARAADLASLRLMLSGGAPIAPALVRTVLEVLGCEYAQTYGMTETSPYLTISLLSDAMRRLPAAEQLAIRCKTGRPFRSVELRVVGDDGRDVPRDGKSVGEIRARGETVMRGYWNDPEATREAFVDGWLRTGDLAVIDREGYLTIVDRRKDVIKTGGETVYTTEVENALHAHPAVLEAAVLGIQDDDLGERIVAGVVLRPGMSASADELRESCRASLAGFKVPREVRFLRELPRTGSGKISKRALRELDSFRGV